MNEAKIFVISGGLGASGEHLVQTVLAQFNHTNVNVEVIPNFRDPTQLDEVMSRVLVADGIVVHTLVDPTMRECLASALEENHIVTIDLIGQLIDELTNMLCQKPLGEPGRYHKLQEGYFKRIAAIEFTVEHDDGKRAHELPLADIVLAGVSRVGKTPLSMFLSTFGWKVANVPIVQGVSPPQELFELDTRRIFGLIVEAGQLVEYRKRRQRSLGVMGETSYVDPERIFEELEFTKRVFRRGQFKRIDMTDKPIEEAADEIITAMKRNLRRSIL